MNRSFRLLLALLAAFALLASACGSDSPVGDVVDAASDAVDDAADAVEDVVDGDDDDAMDDEDHNDDDAMDDDAMDDDAAMADSDTSVGLVYDIGGRGDLSFNDSAAAGLEKADADLGIGFSEASPNNDGSNRAELLQLAADANNIVIGVGFLFEGDAAAVAAENPDTNFAVIDSGMLDFSQDPPAPYGDNVAGLIFAEEQGSFLVGAAAALKSETGQLGFIGGVCCFGLIEKFEAGFRAGALAVNPDIEIVAEYITDAPDFDGFNQPDRAQVIATTMYEDGADIIYHAAGGAGNGMFQAAKDYSDDNGTKVWGIGVDSDQYNTIGAVDPDLQEYVLTSMLKRVDVAVFEILKSQQDGSFNAGPTTYDLSVDGVGYSTSGGFVDDIADQLDAFKADIVAGNITVPTDPANLDAVPAAPTTVDTTVGLVYDIGGRGDLSFNDSAAAGLEKADADLGIGFSEASPNNDGSNRAELLQLAADANNIVIGVGFLFEGDAAAVAAENPDTNFAVIDSGMLDFSQDPPAPYGDNVAGLVFAEEQGSFLVGAAAALKSETGQLGFIGGVCCFGLIEKFEAGFRAGALAVNPDIEIVAEYITDAPDFDGFNQPDRAQVIATTMYEDGADIIYHAAGGAGNGMFQAAKDYSDDNGTKVWGIGVDSDQYNTIGAVDPDLQEYVLTSMLKRVDVAVFEILKSQQDGSFNAGPTTYDLSVDGVGYSTSGGFVDDIADQLDAFKADIVAGNITVPTDPTEIGG